MAEEQPKFVCIPSKAVEDMKSDRKLCCIVFIEGMEPELPLGIMTVLHGGTRKELTVEILRNLHVRFGDVDEFDLERFFPGRISTKEKLKRIIQKQYPGEVSIEDATALFFYLAKPHGDLD